MAYTLDPHTALEPGAASPQMHALVLYLDCGHMQWEPDPALTAAALFSRAVHCRSGDGQRGIMGYERRSCWVPDGGERVFIPADQPC